MKILKYLLYLILALVVVFLIMGLVGPKDFNVSRDILVEASPEVLYPHVSDLRKTHEWNAWNRMDPDMPITYEGDDGTIGSSAEWNSENPKVGHGKQTLLQLDPNKEVENQMEFFTPFGSMKSNGFTKLEPVDGGTKVTYGFNGENSFFARATSLMMDREGMVGPMFEEGLVRLKLIAEKIESEEPIVDVPLESKY